MLWISQRLLPASAIVALTAFHQVATVLLDEADSGLELLMHRHAELASANAELASANAELASANADLEKGGVVQQQHHTRGSEAVEAVTHITASEVPDAAARGSFIETSGSRTREIDDAYSNPFVEEGKMTPASADTETLENAFDVSVQAQSKRHPADTPTSAITTASDMPKRIPRYAEAEVSVVEETDAPLLADVRAPLAQQVEEPKHLAVSLPAYAVTDAKQEEEEPLPVSPVSPGIEAVVVVIDAKQEEEEDEAQPVSNTDAIGKNPLGADKAAVGCLIPSDLWCTYKGSVISLDVDCDGDGVPDPLCRDLDGNIGFLGSTNSCMDTWPKGACLQAPKTKQTNHHMFVIVIGCLILGIGVLVAAYKVCTCLGCIKREPPRQPASGAEQMKQLNKRQRAAAGLSPNKELDELGS